ncbi:MAG: hypothetical protein GKR87_16565 [Kiritimatiellae bacterium]|nr:hypothetical protein [Kiritimatiellia bacterium]
MNTGMLPALAQQVMKNRQILSDGFRNISSFGLFFLYKDKVQKKAFLKYLNQLALLVLGLIIPRDNPFLPYGTPMNLYGALFPMEFPFYTPT